MYVCVQQICVGIYGYLRIRVGMCGYAWYVGVGVGFVQGMCGNVWVCFNMCGASILHIPMAFAFPTLDCFGFLLAFGSYPVYGQHAK